VSRVLCKRPGFVCGDGVQGKGAVPLPLPISVFSTRTLTGTAKWPSKEKNPDKLRIPLAFKKTLLAALETPPEPRKKKKKATSA
jgi:hypothetical protein